MSTKEEKKTVDMRKTGGEVDVVVFNLINHANDKTEQVRMSILRAMVEISQHQPELVLTGIASFISKRGDKIDQTHRIHLLEILVRVLEDAREKISKDVANDLITFACQEMIASTEVKSDWQGPSSQALVSLSHTFPDFVIESLLSVFKPGVEPHYYVIKSLADVANANPVALTLHLRDIINRVTPVLGLVRKPAMKWVFTTALGRFAEAINLFMANADAATMPKANFSDFEADMTSAWDVIFHKWIGDSEPKVRFAVVQSLGYVSSVLAQRDFEPRLQKLAPTYLAMYKREPRSEHLPITQGMCALLTKAVADPACLVSESGLLLTQIMTGLHELICLPPENPMTNPDSLRCRNEVLRCWELLCGAMPHQVLPFVVGRFQLKSTSVRVGSLVILRHFVNSLDSVLQDSRPTVMSAVTTLVSESEPTLRRTILQLVASMANQGYLTLDGGETLVRFIVEQCAAKPAPKDTKDAKPKDDGAAELKRMAEYMLSVLATRVESAAAVMWPYLLELLGVKSLAAASSVLCQAVHDIAKHKKDAGDMSYIVNFAHHVNLPSPQKLMVTLFLLASQPHKQKNLGVHAAGAAAFLGESLHPALGTYWAETMPALVQHLEQHGQSETGFALVKWQDTVLKVWRESLVVIGNEQWVGELATTLGLMFKTHAKDPETLRLVHRFLGATLSRLQNKSLISAQLDLMLGAVNHLNEAEQRGFAQGLGMAGNPHLDMVLPKVTDLLLTTPEHKKSSGGFFGFGAKKDTGPDDEVKATAILAYGYVTAYANTELVLSRIDVHILHNIIPLLALPPADPKAARSAVKTTPILKVQIAKALDLIGKAVNPARLPAGQKHFTLKKRDDLVRGLLAMIDERDGKDKEKPGNELRMLVLGTLATLTLLEPKYPKALLELLLDHVQPMFSMLLDKPKEGKDAKAKDVEDADAPGAKLMDHVNALLQALVQADPSVDLVLMILARLEPLLGHKSAVVRQRAVAAYLVVLKKFVPKIAQDKVPQKEPCFPELGKRLSFLLARANESVDATRSLAVEAVQALLYLDQLLGNPDEPKSKPEIKLLTAVKTKLAAPHPPLVPGAAAPTSIEVCQHRYAMLDDVVGVISGVSVSGEVVALIRALVPRLADHDAHAAMGVARSLAKLLALKGADLKPELQEAVAALLEALKKVKDMDVKRAVLSSFRMLAKMHFEDVLNLLLKAATPLPREQLECLMALIDPIDGVMTDSGALDAEYAPIVIPGLDSNKQLSEKTLLHLVSVINDTPLDTKTPTPVVMAATCALSLVFCVTAGEPVMARVEDKDDKSKKVDEVVESVYLNSVHDAAARNALQALVATHYAPLCATLLMRCGTAHGVDEHVSAKQAARALKRFFKAARQDPLLAALEEQESKEDLAAHDDVGRMLLREVSDAWETMDSETYDDAITVVTRQVCRHKPGKMGEILTFLSSFYSQQAYVGQRVVATAMLAEFVSHSADDHALQAELIKFLLPRVADKVAKVRKQALRGLGNLVMVWTEQIAQHATAVISSLSGASEDAEAEVAAEAVSALTRIAKVVDLVTIGPMLVSICFRMRPTFDRKSAKVRKAAFTLFSELCHFGRKLELDDSSVNENFIDQVHFNLPIYLAHVNEDDRDTAECAFKGLRNIFALLDDSLVALVDRVGEVDEDNYDSFINECSKLLALHYGDRLRGYLDSCVGYFPSTWTRIRANAVYMLACLIRHSRESKMADARKKLNMHALTAAVVKMLEQDNESVRNKTVKALSLLYDV